MLRVELLRMELLGWLLSWLIVLALWGIVSRNERPGRAERPGNAYAAVTYLDQTSPWPPPELQPGVESVRIESSVQLESGERVVRARDIVIGTPTDRTLPEMYVSPWQDQ